jgi:hypothetical protein
LVYAIVCIEIKIGDRYAACGSYWAWNGIPSGGWG